MENKPRMAFIDNSLHQKTASGDFIRELFSEYFEITNYWDDSWKTDKFEIPITELNKYDYLFFEQTFPPLSLLPKIKPQIIWAPMYDGYDTSWSFWKSISCYPIKIINFSRKLEARSKRFNIESIYAQFYLNPDKLSQDLPTEGNIFYFWHRGPIEWDTIKTVLPKDQINKFIFRSNTDPSYYTPDISEKEKVEYRMEIIEEKYIEKEKYLSIMSSANIYIAPRPKEGIGLSFIEALAMGHVVIANDDSTMNEYVEDKKDGYLFDINNPKMIDFSNIEMVRKKSKEKALQGYKNWEKTKVNIIDFIKSPVKNNSSKITAPLFRALHNLKIKKVVAKRTIDRYKTKTRRLIKRG